MTRGFVPVAGFETRSGVVVVPFHSLSPDPHDDLFSRGLTEDLSVALSSNAHLAVIADRSAACIDRDSSLDVLRRELGVRYVIEGTARREGTRVRVTAKLIDAESGRQLFATRCDGEKDCALEIQAEIASELLQSLGVEVREFELDRIRRKAAYDPVAFELFREGWRYFNAFRKSLEPRARQCFRSAIQREPNLAEAHALLGGSLSKEYGMGWRNDREFIERAQLHVDRALELDPAVAEGHVVQAGIDLWRADHTAAEISATEALRFNPSHDVAYMFLAMARGARGDFAGAAQASEISSRLNPRVLSPYRALDAAMAYFAGRVEEACSTWEALRADNPDLIVPRLSLALHYQRGSQSAEARAAINEVLDTSPGFRIESATRLLRSEDPTLVGALRDAGLPD